MVGIFNLLIVDYLKSIIFAANYICKLYFMKKKTNESKMGLCFIYKDGSEEIVRDCSSKIKLRFNVFVIYALQHYIDGFVEVQLLDCSGRVFRSFKQHF